MATIETPIGSLKGRAGPELTLGAPATLFIRPESLKLAAPEATPDLMADIATAAEALVAGEVK